MARSRRWTLAVATIEGDFITGILLNRPRLVKNVRYREKVSVNVEDVVDWAYVRDGKETGKFTVKAIQEIQGGQAGTPAPTTSPSK